jgi:HTH-type transcriptional regulator/antitoxin HipB
MPYKAQYFPIGKLFDEGMMPYTPEKIGQSVRETRRNAGISQQDLALASGVGVRFIVDLEKGKSTCQLGKVLTVLCTLGIGVMLSFPPIAKRK